MNEPREPHPFLPPWRVTIGPLHETGRGLLSPPIAAQVGLVDDFQLLLGTMKVEVNPPAAQIFFDTRLMWQGEVGRKHRLVWHRCMEKQLGTRDKNTGAFRCVHYGIGLAFDGGSHGYKLFEDGRLVEGL